MIAIRNYKRPLVTSALVVSLAMAGAAAAMDRLAFRMSYSHRGYVTGSQYAEGLSVSLSIREVNVTSGKSEICAYFNNSNALSWEGGYRLTDRDVNSTFATVRVNGNSTATRCELLPVANYYYMVLNRYD